MTSFVSALSPSGQSRGIPETGSVSQTPTGEKKDDRDDAGTPVSSATEAKPLRPRY